MAGREREVLIKIETYWNVNVLPVAKQITTVLIKIETYWNVNSKSMIAFLYSIEN